MDLAKLFKTKSYQERERDMALFRELVEKNKQIPDFSGMRVQREEEPEIKAGQWYRLDDKTFLRIGYVYEKDDPLAFAPQVFTRGETGEFALKEGLYGEALPAAEAGKHRMLDDLLASKMEAMYLAQWDRIHRNRHFEELEKEYFEVVRQRKAAA